MKRNLIYSILMVSCFSGWTQMQQGDVQAAEYIIEKEKEVALPAANRFFSPATIAPATGRKVSVEFNLFEPTFNVPGFQPNLTVIRLEKRKMIELDNHFLRLGFGSYLSPLVDYRFSSNSSGSSRIGAQLFHESHLIGPVQKELSAENNTKAGLWHQFDGANVSAFSQFSFGLESYYPYGVLVGNPAIDQDSLGYERYSLQTVGFRTRISGQLGAGSLQFLIDPDWKMTSIKKKDANDPFNSENRITGSMGLKSALGNQSQLGITLNLAFAGYESMGMKTNRGWYSIEPSFMNESGAFSFTIGLQTGVYSDTIGKYNYFLLPKIYANYRLNGSISIYANVEGDLGENTLDQVSQTNRYLEDSLILRTTIDKLGVRVGARGYATDRLSYDVYYRSKLIDNQAYFINSTDEFWLYGLVYDTKTMTQLTFGASLGYRVSEKLNFDVDFKWHSYNSGSGQLPLFVPTMQTKFGITITPVPSLRIRPQFILLDGLKGWESDASVTLDPIMDLGLDTDYQITQKWGAYLKLRNMLGQENQRFYYYSTRTFEIKAGVSFQF